jgi:hypothetical protein
VLATYAPVAARLHLALFYFYGVYYHWAKRATGGLRVGQGLKGNVWCGWSAQVAARLHLALFCFYSPITTGQSGLRVSLSTLRVQVWLAGLRWWPRGVLCHALVHRTDAPATAPGSPLLPLCTLPVG